MVNKIAKEIENIDRARAFLYGVLSLFFTFTYEKKETIKEILRGLEIIISNPVNVQMQRAAKEVKRKIEENYEALFDEYDQLFLTPDGDMIRTSASFFTEGIESGKKRLEMIEYIIKTPIRKSKNYKEHEDDLGFVLSFMSKIILEGEKYKSLQKDVFKNILNVFVDDLFDAILRGKNVDIYKDVVEMAAPFIEFERLYFDVEKPKKVKAKKVQDKNIPYQNLKHKGHKRVSNDTCSTTAEDEEPVEEI